MGVPARVRQRPPQRNTLANCNRRVPPRSSCELTLRDTVDSSDDNTDATGALPQELGQPRKVLMHTSKGLTQCMYIHVHVYMCVHVYKFVCVYAHTYMYTHTI